MQAKLCENQAPPIEQGSAATQSMRGCAPWPPEAPPGAYAATAARIDRQPASASGPAREPGWPAPGACRVSLFRGVMQGRDVRQLQARCACHKDRSRWRVVAAAERGGVRASKALGAPCCNLNPRVSHLQARCVQDHDARAPKAFCSKQLPQAVACQTYVGPARARERGAQRSAATGSGTPPARAVVHSLHRGTHRSPVWRS